MCENYKPLLWTSPVIFDLRALEEFDDLSNDIEMLKKEGIVQVQPREHIVVANREKLHAKIFSGC